MAKINILDSSIYNLIAAGEVVERPASVIKELVENAIDAQSSQIKIEIIEGGIKQIKVTDNGHGIEQEYMVNAFLPHATSKIEKASDLDNIFTLGFRGEALASIAAVSDVKLISKVENCELGNEICLSAGKIISQNSVGASNGTTIIVSNLFFNVPARAKFLKKPKTEEQEITNIIERFILANPSLSISYYADGKLILHNQGGSLKEAIYSVYGKQAISETLTVESKKDGIELSGFIGRPSFAKPNRTYQTIVINGRYVNNTTIATAVTNAYGEMLMKRRYPFFVLDIKVDPTCVDVNVHPNKMEVRFENSGKIFSFVYDAVSRTLSEMDYVLQVDTQTGEVTKMHQGMQIAPSTNNTELPTTAMSTGTTSTAKNIDKAGVDLSHLTSMSYQEPTMQSSPEKQALVDTAIKFTSTSSQVADGFGLGSHLLEKLASKSNPKVEQQQLETHELTTAQIKTVGKLFNTYILIEYGDNLYLIDQHAGHERILYEQFKREVNSNKLVVQPLMFPYILSLNAVEYNLIESILDQIRALGFEIDDFGDRTFKISSVPMLLSGLNFEEFFSNFLRDVQGGIKFENSDLIKDKLMQHSCKSAVKGGNDLSKTEIESLFEQMNNEKIPLFCPHGRPIAVRITKTEIEKWFKRIV